MPAREARGWGRGPRPHPPNRPRPSETAPGAPGAGRMEKYPAGGAKRPRGPFKRFLEGVWGFGLGAGIAWDGPRRPVNAPLGPGGALGWVGIVGWGPEGLRGRVFGDKAPRTTDGGPIGGSGSERSEAAVRQKKIPPGEKIPRRREKIPPGGKRGPGEARRRGRMGEGPASAPSSAISGSGWRSSGRRSARAAPGSAGPA